MIAVIKGDIIASRKISNPEKWLKPLKELLSSWGKTPKQWELVWGDFFQLEVPNPEDALRKVLIIKSLIKQTTPKESSRRVSAIDVRLAIGIGEKTYAAKRISESNGTAFIHAGAKFDSLRKEKRTIAIQSPWAEFDDEMNLYLRLAGTFADRWTVSSAELAKMVLENPHSTQQEIGEKLGIRQNSVSSRWNTACIDEVRAVEKVYREKLEKRLK